MVGCFGAEADHREAELFCNTVHKVAQEVIAVDRTDADAYRIEALGFFLEVHGDDRVSVLRGKTDCCLAVSLMYLNRAIILLESAHLIAKERMTVRTSHVMGSVHT